MNFLHDGSVTRDGLLLALAARQGGVITRTQAIDSGLSPRSIQYRVKAGEWQRVLRSVYRLIDMADADDLLRAAIAALPGAVVSHESAAELLEIRRVPRGRAVVSVHTRTTHEFPRVTVHRNHDLSPDHVLHADGLPVTSIQRTVVDLAQIISRKHVRRIVDDLIAERRVTVEEIRLVHDQVARRGKPGSAALRAVLNERGEGPAASASRLELEGLKVLRAHGLPEPVLEYPIPWHTTKRFDAAYPNLRVAIEWDSRRWHSLVDAFERDRQRDRTAAVHGWYVLRFTWKDVTERSNEVARTVASMLEVREAGVL